jgi:hypothetical protein
MRNLTLVLTLLGALLCSWSIAFAADSAEQSEGFSGRISAGAGYMTSTDQLKTTDENKRIDSLSGDADWYDKFMPLALFNLRYTFAESGRQVYFGTPPELSGPPGLSLGFVQPFSDGSKLDLSVFTHLFSEVWRDPYLTNVKTPVSTTTAPVSCTTRFSAPALSSHTHFPGWTLMWTISVIDSMTWNAMATCITPKSNITFGRASPCRWFRALNCPSVT